MFHNGATQHDVGFVQKTRDKRITLCNLTEMNSLVSTIMSVNVVLWRTQTPVSHVEASETGLTICVVDKNFLDCCLERFDVNVANFLTSSEHVLTVRKPCRHKSRWNGFSPYNNGFFESHSSFSCQSSSKVV